MINLEAYHMGKRSLFHYNHEKMERKRHLKFPPSKFYLTNKATDMIYRDMK